MRTDALAEIPQFVTVYGQAGRVVGIAHVDQRRVVIDGGGHCLQVNRHVIAQWHGFHRNADSFCVVQMCGVGQCRRQNMAVFPPRCHGRTECFIGAGAEAHIVLSDGLLFGNCRAQLSQHIASVVGTVSGCVVRCRKRFWTGAVWVLVEIELHESRCRGVFRQGAAGQVKGRDAAGDTGEKRSPTDCSCHDNILSCLQ